MHRYRKLFHRSLVSASETTPGDASFPLTLPESTSDRDHVGFNLNFVITRRTSLCTPARTSERPDDDDEGLTVVEHLVSLLPDWAAGVSHG